MSKETRKKNLFAGLGAVTAVAVGIGVAVSVVNKESGPAAAEVTVRAVEELPADFALGVDISSVLSLEASGVVFRDEQGNPGDLFRIMADSGVTDVRIRVWNDPYDEQGRGYGGGTVDVERATEIGRRATEAGMGVLVDFHYSDFWADPAKQQAPKAWETLNGPERAAATGEFTKAALEQMKAAGVRVEMVQVGNETNNGVAGLTSWPDMTAVFSEGAASVREVFPDALVLIHFANPEREGEYARYAQILDHFEVDYDVFASSYYPFWHGSLENLTGVLSDIANTYDKQVLVAETSWVFTLEEGDSTSNVVGDAELASAYAVSPQGQADAFRDTVQAVVDVGPAGIGVFYWEPAWLPVGPPDQLDANRELWNKDGSGWASEYAASYDPADAGEHWGGSGWDNQALFNFDGTQLPSLKMFKYVRTGAVAPLAVTRVEVVRVQAPLGGAVELPESVEVFFNDGTSESQAVEWGSLPSTAEDATHEVLGKLSDGTPVRAIVRVQVPNLVVNPGFEDDDLSAWELDSDAQTFRVVADNAPAAIDERVLNFWSDTAFKFTAQQRLQNVPPGVYRVEVSVHGADAGDQGAKLNLVATSGSEQWNAPLELNGWQTWFTASLGQVTVGEDGVLTVTVTGEMGPEDWGFIDEFVVTPVG